VIVVPVASVISTGNPQASSVCAGTSAVSTAPAVVPAPAAGPSVDIVGCAPAAVPATPPSRAVVTSTAIAIAKLFRIGLTTGLVQ